MSPYCFKKILQKVTIVKLPLPVKRLVIVTGISMLVFFLLCLLFPLKDRIEYSTTIEGSDGEVLHAFLTVDEKWRMKTELNEISPLLRKTILAKEDKHFYKHPGMNPFAFARAAVMNIAKGKRTSGASTITMQVARALEPRKRNLFSKTIEVFRAFQLEMKYSKEEILQIYLNLVPYGGNIEGVKAASLLYFKKDPDHLSLAEITALSIIPNRPSSLVIGKHNERIKQERNRWLMKFAEDGVFSKKEIEDAMEEPLNAYRNTVPKYIPHLSYKLKKSFKENNISTYIQLNEQLKIEKLTEDYIRHLKLKNINNAAVIVIDNKTNKVISYVGSASFKDTIDAGQVNGAAAVRQPGSTLKPLLYGICMDEGLLTPRTMLSDVAINYSGYSPENYDKKFNGQVTMEYALDHSLNIPSVKMLQQLGKDKLVYKLSSAQFQQIKKDQRKLGLSMILGGCGATLEELTGLFAAFANNGIYQSPRYHENKQVISKTEILSPASNYMITEILSKVNRPDFPLNWMATERMPKIAWKTGTSYGRRDAWSIGFNKNYTVGVWIGNFSGQGIPELSGANTATPLLFRIFNTLDYDSNTDWFEPPASLEIRKVCSATGLPPGIHCTNLLSDQFIPLTSSTIVCAHIQEIKISPDEKISYCLTCAPASGYRKKLLQVIPAELQEYYLNNNKPFEKLPEHNPECSKVFSGAGPRIVSPSNQTEYFISKKDPEPLLLKAVAGPDVSKLYWYVNDQFYKSTGAGEGIYYLPGEGQLKISCTDDKGRNRNIRVMVKYAAL